jgi:hypothetical protein
MFAIGDAGKTGQVDPETSGKARGIRAGAARLPGNDTGIPRVPGEQSSYTRYLIRCCPASPFSGSSISCHLTTTRNIAVLTAWLLKHPRKPHYVSEIDQFFRW